MSTAALLHPCSALSSLWIASLWQGFALAVVAALMLRAMPRLSPRLRYRVWAAAYAACVLLPVCEMRAQWPAAPRAAMAAALASDPAKAFAPLLSVDSRWTLLLAGLWVAGSLFAALRLGAGLWSIRQLLGSAAPAEAEKQDQYAHLLHLQSRGSVRLLVSERIENPVATGYLRPAVVLPRALFAALSDEQAEQVLRHELEHLARRDDWAALVAGCLRCVFPLHPALLWFERQLLATREMACDDAVLRAAAPRAYALNLTQIAESATVSRGLHAVPSLLGARSQLALRIDHILSARRESVAGARGALCVAVAALLVCSALLMRSPALVAFRAQSEAVPARAVLRASALPAIAHPVIRAAIAPSIRPAALRLRRRSVTLAPRLIAALHTPAPVTVNTAVSVQPTAVLVLWTDPEQGFFATLVFTPGSTPAAGFLPGFSRTTLPRQAFFSLDI